MAGAVAAGVVQRADKTWTWVAACGESGEGQSREGARDAFKAHKGACGTCSNKTTRTTGEVMMAATTAKANKKPIKAQKADKTAPKEKAPRAATVPDKTVDAIIARLRAGTTTVKAESRALGFSYNGPLRRAISEKIGRDAYFTLIGPKPKTEKKKEAAKKAAPKKAAPKKAAKKKAAAVASIVQDTDTPTEENEA